MFIDYDARMTRQTRPLEPDVRLLAALADPVRLDILRELAGSAEVCACDFTDCCSVSQPTVSHHLKVLREAGAVVSERRGNSIYYRIAPDLLDRLGGIARGLVPGGLVGVETLAGAGRRSAPTITTTVARA
jgi:ArsR family transcriptional regulator, arsenate/arsenite/antimonite-responsive transcriptional repressor